MHESNSEFRQGFEQAVLSSIATEIERDLAEKGNWDQLFRALPKNVILVASSSRGGSTLLAEILRQSKRLLHLPGEINPYLRLTGLTYPWGPHSSDYLGSGDIPPETILDELLAYEIGCRVPANELLDDDVANLARRTFIRLKLQWPNLPIGLEETRCWTVDSLRQLNVAPAGSEHAMPKWTMFTLQLLSKVRAVYDSVHPMYYDIPQSHVTHMLGRLQPPSRLQSPVVIEEPPFLQFLPWQRATKREVMELPFVIKSPSNAYRLSFFKNYFSEARIRVIHLTRNPAAAINGLLDGWRWHGFHSYPMRTLSLRDFGLSSENSRGWWKFDLPLGWESWIDKPLPAVCAFQWWSSHACIMKTLKAEKFSCFRLKFEDLIRDEGTRCKVIDELCSWMEIPFDEPLRKFVEGDLPVVMATAAPVPSRWRRNPAVAHVINQPRISQMATHLGYRLDKSDWV